MFFKVNRLFASGTIAIFGIALSAYSSLAALPSFNDSKGYYVAIVTVNSYSYRVLKSGFVANDFNQDYPIPPLDSLNWSYVKDLSITQGYSVSSKEQVSCFGYYCGDAVSTFIYGNHYTGHYIFQGRQLSLDFDEFVDHIYEASPGGNLPAFFGDRDTVWQTDGHSSLVLIKNASGKLIYQSPSSPPDYRKRDREKRAKSEPPKKPAPCNFKDFVFRDDMVCEENATRSDGKHTINDYPFWYGDPNYNWKPSDKN